MRGNCRSKRKEKKKSVMLARYYDLNLAEDGQEGGISTIPRPMNDGFRYPSTSPRRLRDTGLELIRVGQNEGGKKRIQKAQREVGRDRQKIPKGEIKRCEKSRTYLDIMSA